MELSQLLINNTTTNKRPCGCERIKLEQLVKRVLRKPDNLGWLVSEEYMTILASPGDWVRTLDEISRAAKEELDQQQGVR